jgi:hypothetical protein
MGRMDSERLVIWVPGSGSFQSTDIGAVTELSLSITTNDLLVLGFS